mmetsp:Transcript_93180/g.252756  ORF Transcript_93180/g.252756 Transcript_93180/m.252756 type:complete len:203 (+) Transcript_93180:1279-1887(+)
MDPLWIFASFSFCESDSIPTSPRSRERVCNAYSLSDTPSYLLSYAGISPVSASRPLLNASWLTWWRDAFDVDDVRYAGPDDGSSRRRSSDSSARSSAASAADRRSASLTPEAEAPRASREACAAWSAACNSSPAPSAPPSPWTCSAAAARSRRQASRGPERARGHSAMARRRTSMIKVYGAWSRAGACPRRAGRESFEPRRP